jgi:hypothetical protein
MPRPNRLLRGSEATGLNDPLLVISDGAPGIIKAIEFARCPLALPGASHAH